MTLTVRDYATALLQAVDGMDEKGVREAARRFAALMRERGLEYLLPPIADALPDAQRAGAAAVHVESARPLDADEVARAVRAIGSAPATSVVTAAVRPELLGGVRVIGDDRLLDASVRRRLDDLARATGAKTSATSRVR